jgi:hypothetical protein
MRMATLQPSRGRSGADVAATTREPPPRIEAEALRSLEPKAPVNTATSSARAPSGNLNSADEFRIGKSQKLPVTFQNSSSWVSKKRI